MLTRWTNWDDFDRAFFQLDDMRRRLGSSFEGNERTAPGWGWPRLSIHDEGTALALYAELPGITEKDFTLTLNHDTLTIQGARKVEAPQGYTAHRTERPAFDFARSFTLPVKVDPERTTATLKDGLLTVRLEKAAEVQMKRINVQAK